MHWISNFVFSTDIFLWGKPHSLSCKKSVIKQIFFDKIKSPFSHGASNSKENSSRPHLPTGRRTGIRCIANYACTILSRKARIITVACVVQFAAAVFWYPAGIRDFVFYSPECAFWVPSGSWCAVSKKPDFFRSRYARVCFASVSREYQLLTRLLSLRHFEFKLPRYTIVTRWTWKLDLLSFHISTSSSSDSISQHDLSKKRFFQTLPAAWSKHTRKKSQMSYPRRKKMRYLPNR